MFRYLPLVAAAALLAPAAASAQGPVIYACVKVVGDQGVRIVGAAEACRPNEVKIQWNTVGPEGPAGPQGPQGEPGPEGPQGAPGEGAAPAEFGVAEVWVQRGANPASFWARYSTRLGSPVGDSSGGAFRFTCSTANAPCRVSVKAAILSSTAGSGGVYPRLLVYRQDFATAGLPTNNSSAPMKYCEYADGSFSPTTLDGIAPLATQVASATPTTAAIGLHIGGSADCGGPVATSGLVPEITVPAGYYDVFASFTFVKP